MLNVKLVRIYEVTGTKPSSRWESTGKIYLVCLFIIIFFFTKAIQKVHDKFILLIHRIWNLNVVS